MATRTLFDQSGGRVALGSELGRGGEGSVFELPASPGLVAKVYHKRPAPEQAEKLRAMVETGSPGLFKTAAWPTAVLHDHVGGPVVGLLMPRVRDPKEVHTLYSPAHRKHAFPNADWAFLVHTAMNCALAFETMHRHGHVIGDVNQSNVLVKSADATVFLIDCDSYQITGRGRVYPCEVGVPQYTPPELQETGFKNVRRTTNHDCFGLAVLVFHLLMMGRHPFAGRFLGKGEMPLESAIKECRFAFGGLAAANLMAPPPKSLPMTALAPDLVTLFEKAFSRHSSQSSARPTAAEWAHALGAFGKQLKRCTADPGHVFLARLGQCPWCELMRDGAPNFFISVAIHRAAAGTSTFVLAVAWQQIESVKPPATAVPVFSARPRNRLVPAPLPDDLPRSVPERICVPREFMQNLVGVVALVLVALVPLVCLSGVSNLFPVMGAVGFVGALGFGIWWFVLESVRSQVESNANYDRDRIRDALSHEYSRRYDIWDRWGAHLRALEKRWRAEAGQHDAAFARYRAHLDAVRRRLQGLHDEYRTEYTGLESNAAAYQLQIHLENHCISDGKIPNIGPARIAVLASYGIETAYDIEETQILNVPGFGNALTGKLLDWRATIERSFRFDPKTGVPSEARRKLEMKYAQLRQQCEVELTQGPAQLKTISAQAEQQLAPIRNDINQATTMVAQAEADLSVIDARSLDA